MQQVPQPQISKSMSPSSVVLSFSTTRSGSTKFQTKKYCHLLPQSFRITLKDTSSISINPLGFNLSINFHKNLYIPPWLQKIFKFVVFRQVENEFVSRKMKVDIVTKAKLFPRSLLSPQGKDKLLIPPVKGEDCENLFQNELP